MRPDRPSTAAAELGPVMLKNAVNNDGRDFVARIGKLESPFDFEAETFCALTSASGEKR